MTIDYLSLTAFTNLKTIALLLLTELFGYDLPEDADWSDFFHKVDVSARGYKVLYQGPENITVYAYPSDGLHCHIEIKGQSLAAIDEKHIAQFSLALSIQDFRWRFSRIDVAFDHCSFTPLMCYESYQSGCFRTKARRNSGDWRQNFKGSTFYIGSRASNRYLRIYDMRGYTRTEIVLKKEYAEEVGKALADLDHVKWVSLGYLKSFIEFTSEPVTGKNSSRAKNIYWWDDLVGDAEKISVKTKTSSEDFLFQKTKRYFERMSSTLCVFRFGLGVDLNSFAMEQRDQLGSKHLQKIEILEKQRSS